MVAVDKMNHPQGIFTEQDAIRLMAERRVVAQLRMSDVMSGSPLTAPSNLDSRDAYRLISEKGFRHLVVVDDSGSVAGVVSEADFLQHMGMEYLVGIKNVSSAMTRNLISLKEDATLADAVDLMTRKKISCVIVVRNYIPARHYYGTRRSGARAHRQRPDAGRHRQRDEIAGANHRCFHADTGRNTADGKIRYPPPGRGRRTGYWPVLSPATTSSRPCREIYRISVRDAGPADKDLHLALQQVEQTRQQLLYHGLMEQVNDAIVVLKAESGVIVDCNEQACRDLDYTRDELLRMTIFDFTTRLTSGPVWQAELEAIEREGHRLTETYHRRRDGTRIPVEINARLIWKNDERFIVAVARDLSERKRAESQLHLQDTALNSSANAVVITDKDAIIQWANPAFSEMTGYALEEAIGMHPKDLVKSGIQPREFYERLWNTILNGKVWRGELVNKRKDGSVYTEEMTITPVHSENSAITHFIAVKQNISERKKIEEQLREAAGVMGRVRMKVWLSPMQLHASSLANEAYTTITGATRRMKSSARTRHSLVLDGRKIHFTHPCGKY